MPPPFNVSKDAAKVVQKSGRYAKLIVNTLRFLEWGLVWVAEAIDYEVAADNEEADEADDCEKVCHGISVSGVCVTFVFVFLMVFMLRKLSVACQAFSCYVNHP